VLQGRGVGDEVMNYESVGAVPSRELPGEKSSPEAVRRRALQGYLAHKKLSP